ncbi:MAG TPA: c-type cytochrome [Polyangiaceae bacterium]|nr:c-type cytochrome [Polyangiaceae bacterium]
MKLSSRKICKWLGITLAAVTCIVGALAGRARWVVSRSYGFVAKPPITADRSAVGVARGELLFQSLCIECHRGVDGRATGKHLAEVPEFLGKFYSANLAHPEHGVRRRSDAELARVLRFGVLPDGRLSAAMNGFGKLGDADVAALLGYMRSDADVFAPAGGETPRTEISLLGSMILTYVAQINVDARASGVPVPPKSVSVEYGRYMVEALDCVGCHTEGFSSAKMQHEKAFAGGFEFVDPTGAKIWSKNITFDESTGIGSWSIDDFERAVTRGITPAGYMVRKPMPLFARLDRTDVAAIYAFLRSMPRVERRNTPGGHPLKKAAPGDSPEMLFVNVGCAACHGKAGPYRSKLTGALAKSDDEVASWILDPQSRKPGSAMPSFQHALNRTQAEALARYVKTIAQEGG